MKMRPDRTNYETWIVDYLDGTLDEDQVMKLLSFLNDNPDIMEEFNDLQISLVNADGVEFNHKNSLKKTVHQLSDSQFEKLCVAHLENDLSPGQQYELEEILKADAGRNRTFTLINKTRLTAPSITYPNKKSLYRLPVLAKTMRIAAAVTGIAATLLILVTLFVNRPEITPPAGNTAVADTFSKPADEPASSDNIVIAADIPKKQAPPVPEKRKYSDIKPLAAEKNIKVELGVDSVIESRMPEVIKAEFRQEVALLSFSEPAGLAVEKGTNTIVTDFYATETEEETRSLTGFLRERLKRPEQAEKEKITAFDVADAGINGLNKLFGWDISLERNTTSDGTVKSVNFNSKLIKVTAPVKKSEPVE